MRHLLHRTQAERTGVAREFRLSRVQKLFSTNYLRSIQPSPCPGFPNRLQFGQNILESRSRAGKLRRAVAEKKGLIMRVKSIRGFSAWAALALILVLTSFGYAADPAAAAAPKKTPDVIFVPTPQPVVERMLELAEVKKGDVVYDLGCGDGRIVVTAAKKYGVKAVGFDIDPQRIKESLENVKTNRLEHLVTIKEADIFTLDLSGADVITLYLLPELNVRLIPQLEKLKPGSRIVSFSFDMEGIKPDKVVHEDGETIYKWTTPLKRETGAATRPKRDPDN